MAEEHVFLSEGGVTVTNARFTYGGQTYAMANVTSVKTSKGSLKWAIIFLVIAFVSGTIHAWPSMIFFGLLGVLAIWFRTTWVILHTAGAEQKALASTNGTFVAKVIGAVNDAIVHRG
jgi:Family of unknown function (DUF6232)